MSPAAPAWPPAASVPRAVSDDAIHLLAPNPSAWTYEGTNTWIVRGAASCVVIDPGSDDPDHLDAIVAASGSSISAVLLTHDHADHSTGARTLADRVGAPLLGFDAAQQDAALVDGDRLDRFGVDGRVLHTPGHSGDSLCFVIGSLLITGDTLLGGGHSSGVFGDYGDYLDSLGRLFALPETERRLGLPGHGPPLVGPEQELRRVAHLRRARADAVRNAVAVDPSADAEAISRILYPSEQTHRVAAVRMIRSICAFLAEDVSGTTPDLASALRRVAEDATEAPR